MSAADVVERLRQPEYTGENRCLPCTVVNVLLAALLAAALSALLTPVVGLLGFGVGLALVYLRGYLVPGTPELTKEYFPPWLLRLFGKEPLETVETGGTVATRTARPAGERSELRARTNGTETTTRGTGGASAVAETTASAGDVDDADATEAADGAPETADDDITAVPGADNPFVAGGIVSPDGATLTPEFRTAWRDRIADLDPDDVEPAAVAAVYGASEARETGDRSYVLDGSKSVRWGSAGALVADVVAAALLADHLEGWAEYDRDRRQSVLLGLRLHLDECPSCGGEVGYDQERVDPCCQKPHLVADAVCTDCGEPIADAAVVDDGTTETVHERLLAA